MITPETIQNTTISISPEVYETSSKTRSRIRILYLLTGPILNPIHRSGPNRHARVGPRWTQPRHFSPSSLLYTTMLCNHAYMTDFGILGDPVRTIVEDQGQICYAIAVRTHEVRAQPYLSW